MDAQHDAGLDLEAEVGRVATPRVVVFEGLWGLGGEHFDPQGQVELRASPDVEGAAERDVVLVGDRRTLALERSGGVDGELECDDPVVGGEGEAFVLGVDEESKREEPDQHRRSGGGALSDRDGARTEGACT